ncbi:MAG: DNA methyltransferase [Candidatus Coatesbacteria bacterium]|nr:DNA methyltransferase [Candidatus Coatesbacteria bacterium]
MTQAALFRQREVLESGAPLAGPPAFKRLREASLDFRGVQASTSVYGIHPYPAMLHFLVVRRLIADYSAQGQLLLDPFVGSGVTAVESMIGARRFVGYDINPLAVLISRVRTTPIERSALLDALAQITDRYGQAGASPVEFHNIHYWFHDEVIEKLSNLRQAIAGIEDDALRRFFEVAFSETVRRASRTRFNEFKLLRKKDDTQEVSVIKTFRDVSLKNVQLVADFYRSNPPRTSIPRVEERDVMDGIPVEDGSVDLVVTSPPYGDSRTTVAYGQFSRLSLRWLGLEEAVDRTSLGSRARELSHDLPSDVLDDFVGAIAEKDEKRAREVFSFYFDLYRCVQIIAQKVRPGGHVCFIVGNRRVKGIELPTDKISADFFESCGFRHISTLVRAISNKRMPSQNSPSNVAGQKDLTMRHEYVVVLRKG